MRKLAGGVLVLVFGGCTSSTTTDGGTSSSSSSSTGGSTSTSQTASSMAAGSSSRAGSSSAAGMSSSSVVASSTSRGNSSSGGGSGGFLADRYPGDVGLAQDPAVIWLEDFERATVAEVTARYDDVANAPGMALSTNVPARSSGQRSMAWTSSATGSSATHVYKRFPDQDEVYVRWYARYQANVQWHHTGVWVGGYNPSIPYPNPQAGRKPTGNERFSVSIEPVFGIGSANPRMDFYNYWMNMHSWEAVPDPQSATGWYGNTLVHQQGFTLDQDTWMCLEVHIRLNPDPSSSAGGFLEVWKNDVLVAQLGDGGALGYWVRDKFCPQAADGTECTDYPPAQGTQMIPLDLQYRNTAALRLNAFWPQNYITEGPDGTVQYDDMVMARERVGCLR